jgi:formylglycine-generating enzyme required for sulfatase activity
VSRVVLRELLLALCQTSADLDAFCIDHFFTISRCFAAGMDLTTKLNLLLTHAKPQELLFYLRRRSPSLVDEHLASHEDATQNSLISRRLELEADLELLRSGREVLRRRKFQPDMLEEAILTLRKNLRSGPELNEGEVLDERYCLMQRLGSGGIGTVWQAEDRSPPSGQPRIIALKILRSQRDVNRFVRGTRRMQSLQPHKYLVEIYSEPKEFDAFHYFPMEYLPGGDLRTAVHEEKLTKEQAINAVLDASRALEHAHQRGVFHRDVKPDNILLTAEFHGKLSDFDFSVALNGSMDTQNGPPGGALFSAPELRQQDSRNSEVVPCPQADIYSIGMTAIFALHARRITVHEREFENFFRDEFHCPENVKCVLYKAVHLRPEQRYKSVQEFRIALERALSGQSVENPVDVVLAATARSQPDLAPAGPEPADAPTLALVASASEVIASQSEPSIPSGVRRRQLSVRAMGITAIGLSVCGLFYIGWSQHARFQSRAWSTELRSAPADLLASRPADLSLNPTSSRVAAGVILSMTAGPNPGVAEGALPKLPPPLDRDSGPRRPPIPTRMTMVKIPAGDYPISFSDNPDKNPPPRTVTVNGFEIDAHEVTVAMYRECVAAGACKEPSAPYANQFCNYDRSLERAGHPMNCVNWEQASTYCSWMKKRLPTEEQWEIAARGGTGSRYPWGDAEPTRGQACWRRSTGTCPAIYGIEHGVKHGGVRLGGMAGNVWEWTRPDCKECSPQPDKRYIRGGAWSTKKSADLLTVTRELANIELVADNIGFRCCH